MKAKALVVALMCLSLVSCAGGQKRPSGPVAGAPTIAVLTVSTAQVKEFGYRKPFAFHLEDNRIERIDTRRLAIVDAFRDQIGERFAKARYPMVSAEAVAAAEAALGASGPLDRQRVHDTLGADWLVLTSLSRWDEQDPGGGANAVIASLAVTLYDIRTGLVVWEGRSQDQEFRLANNLQREPADFVRAILRRVMRDLPPADAW